MKKDMPSEIVTKCSKAIAAKGWNIAFAESTTAGRMHAEFSKAKQSAEILLGGIVCSEVFVKTQILHVPQNLNDKSIPESAEVTQQLAQHASKIFNSKITVGVMGLTTPDGTKTKGKPVDTFIYILTPDKKIKHREVFKGTVDKVFLQAIDKTAELIIESLISL